MRQFLEYKAVEAGISLVKVNPAYTSQMCHYCHHIHPVKGSSYRNGKTFKCGHCGWTGDADLNGAMNIAIIGAFISKPRGSGLSCSLSKDVSGLLPDSVLLCAVGESPVTERAGLTYYNGVMKISNLLIILGAIAIPITIFAVTKAMSAPLPVGFPSPTSHGKIEVKQYPAYRSGTYTYEGNLSQATSNSFNPLFQHISSNNISMTAPVEARYPISTIDQPMQQGKAKVSFLYNNNSISPLKISQNIQVEDHASMLVVSLGVQGAYGYDRYQEDVAKLKEWLDNHPEYEIAGEPREFLYDSPFTPSPLKRREVQIPIRKR